MGDGRHYSRLCTWSNNLCFIPKVWIIPKKISVFINPLTPGAFCKKCIFWTFWWFLGWILAKLALIQLKMHLQHNSSPFLVPASYFTTFWLGHAQKWKFWPTSMGFLIFEFFLLFLFLFFFLFAAVIGLLLGLMQLKNLPRKCHWDGQIWPWSSHV